MSEPTEAEIEAAARAAQIADIHEGHCDPTGSWESYIPTARAALTAAAQVRGADQNMVAEIDRLRRLLKSIQGHPNTHALISGVIQNELDRPTALMPIYGTTEDQGPDVPREAQGGGVR